jgi:hypothetical protein
MGISLETGFISWRRRPAILRWPWRRQPLGWGLRGHGYRAPQTPCRRSGSLPPGRPRTSARPAYFLATSLNAGPTILLSMPWQATQPCLLQQAQRGGPWPAQARSPPQARPAWRRCGTRRARVVSAPCCAPTMRFCSARLPWALRAKSGSIEATAARARSPSCRPRPSRRACRHCRCAAPGLAGPHAMVQRHAVAVGHALLHLGDVAVDSTKLSGTTPPRLSRKAVTA